MKKVWCAHDKFHDICLQNEKSVVCTRQVSWHKPHKEILDSARIVASREYVRRHRMWDGKLSLCFKFQTPNSFGRWKYLRRVHFSILNCTRRLFLGRFQTFPNFYDFKNDTRQILDKQKMSCATRQVSWHFFFKMKKMSCGTRQLSWHIFPKKNSVVCHTTRHILLLLWKIKYLCRVHFSILNCTRQLFLGRFQTFPIFYDVIQCGMVNWAYVSNFSFLTSLEVEIFASCAF